MTALRPRSVLAWAGLLLLLAGLVMSGVTVWLIVGSPADGALQVVLSCLAGLASSVLVVAGVALLLLGPASRLAGDRPGPQPPS